MEYSPDEIAFVRSCINNTNDNEDNRMCKRKSKGRRRIECPAWEPCNRVYEENSNASGLCEQILVNMEERKDLTEEQIRIVDFWLNDIKWEDEENCVPYAGAEPCPNGDECVKRSDNEICINLLGKLGIHKPYEY